MTSEYALFIYNPMMNSTTFAITHHSKEALTIYAHKKFHDNVMFAIYKFREHKTLFTQQVPATMWQLDTKFDGKAIASYHKGFNQPMECAYRIDGGYEWFFKTF